MSLHDEIATIGEQAVIASRELILFTTRQKNSILQSMSDELDARRSEILDANKKDMDDARDEGLSAAMLDRLLLTDARIDSMIKGLQAVSVLKDPIWSRISRWIRPNGLEIVKRRVPIGVIGIIYESRPNVTVDSAGLCIKTSNTVILRGGKESLRSNIAIVNALVEGGRKRGLPGNAIQIIETTDREAVRELVQLEGKVDLIIPRGGEALIKAVAEQARVPVIKHYKGVCHVYVDESANMEMALKVVENAKCQRPGVCNAMETLLVHEKVAFEFLPKLSARLRELGVELRGDSASVSIVPEMKQATEGDWYAEYLDLILAVRVVPSAKIAIEHINKYGSRHSDAIIAESENVQKVFLREVDSAAVYVNASTRFTDGGEFGMGAEIGISTDKLHARGPMGLEELTTYKYTIHGNGQVRG